MYFIDSCALVIWCLWSYITKTLVCNQESIVVLKLTLFVNIPFHWHSCYTHTCTCMVVYVVSRNVSYMYRNQLFNFLTLATSKQDYNVCWTLCILWEWHTTMYTYWSVEYYSACMCIVVCGCSGECASRLNSHAMYICVICTQEVHRHLSYRYFVYS